MMQQQQAMLIQILQKQDCFDRKQSQFDAKLVDVQESLLTPSSTGVNFFTINRDVVTVHRA